MPKKLALFEGLAEKQSQGIQNVDKCVSKAKLRRKKFKSSRYCQFAAFHICFLPYLDVLMGIQINSSLPLAVNEVVIPTAWVLRPFS